MYNWLTALSLQYSVSQTTGLCDPVVIAVPPCEKDVMYSVKIHVFQSVADTFKLIVEILKLERINLPTMIIYGAPYRSNGMFLPR